MVLILESRSHFDLGDLPNLLAAELGVMTVRLERAIRSLDGVARVHVNRWGDGSAHLHMWFLARPHGQLQLRGTFLSLWDSILPPIAESTWRENLALIAAWLADFGGRPLAEPPRIQWQAPSSFSAAPEATASPATDEDGASVIASAEEAPIDPLPGRSGDSAGDRAADSTAVDAADSPTAEGRGGIAAGATGAGTVAGVDIAGGAAVERADIRVSRVADGEADAEGRAETDADEATAEATDSADSRASGVGRVAGDRAESRSSGATGATGTASGR
ncbi:hypothetical protein QTQ03_19715 [Micromonospora sp. WMMA1363]|uniref:hypothetical protein n=1 Tax=Micromonospora sp. WMMA1363 TaxID=3053985 RepID=UPI00259CBB19|nr:hypothetical protein [Micromonospora sp. WMMA1363]MDM4721708.1 hypothetical protein [Micromonospora sp. WMMA1363]